MSLIVGTYFLSAGPKGSNLLIGTAQQIADNLKAMKEAGLTMPLIWPPFNDVPVSKNSMTTSS